MAQVPYQASPDSQAPAEAPNDYTSVSTSPASFGGAVAEGGQAAGQGLLDASKFYNQVAADDSTNNAVDAVGAIFHGEPGKMVMGPDGQMTQDTGFLGKRGADAMRAYPDASKAMDEAIQEQRSGLSTPAARLQFDNETRRMRAGWISQMGNHYDQQQFEWTKDTNTTTIAQGLNAVSQVAGDDAASAAAGERVRNASVKLAQAQYGVSDEVTQGALLSADQQIALTRIRRLSADPGTAMDAERVLNSSMPVLGSIPGIDGIQRQVKGAVIDATMGPAVDRAVSDALTAAQRGTGSAMDISSAIGAQEWRGKGPAPTSVDGAVGPSQITPDTARRYGLDPSKLGDPAYAAMARDTITSKISALPDVQGDPARIAVAYFSGEGNVAPLGSPTPYIHDYKDGNGKSVSSYVADVTGRMGAASSAAGATPSTADALNANMANIQAKAQADAEMLFPNYPDAQDRYVQNVTRRVDQTITQQTRQYQVDTHTVQAILAGDNPPISEEELKARSPQVAAAWASTQINNAQAAMSIERMFDANARGRAVGNGTGFAGYLDRALAPANDPTRLNNPSQLWPFVGAGEAAPLTNTGANALTDLMGLRGTPQGEAAATQIKAFVDQAHSQLSYSNAAAGLTDPKGEAAFGKFMSGTLPIVVKAAKAGNLSAVLDPKSPDFIGKAAATFARTPAQIVTDRLHAEGVRIAPQAIDSPMTMQGLRFAVGEGKISAGEAAWIANRMGFKKPAAAPPSPPAAGALTFDPIPMMGAP